jgi:hypothetical protein
MHQLKSCSEENRSFFQIVCEDQRLRIRMRAMRAGGGL